MNQATKISSFFKIMIILINHIFNAFRCSSLPTSIRPPHSSPLPKKWSVEASVPQHPVYFSFIFCFHHSMDQMLIFLLLAIFLHSQLPLILTAKQPPPPLPKSHIAVQGSVFCDVCYDNTFSRQSYFLPGKKCTFLELFLNTPICGSELIIMNRGKCAYPVQI